MPTADPRGSGARSPSFSDYAAGSSKFGDGLRFGFPPDLLQAARFTDLCQRPSDRGVQPQFLDIFRSK